MEQCTDVDALMKLNEQMAIEFTLRVAEAKKAPKNYYSPAISRVIDYIYHGKNKTLTLNQLASLVNLTPKYLSALFHKETGQTLTVFIHKVLIEKAKNLLAHSDYSLGEISTYLNFSSQSYFISIFTHSFLPFPYFLHPDGILACLSTYRHFCVIGGRQS